MVLAACAQCILLLTAHTQYLQAQTVKKLLGSRDITAGLVMVEDKNSTGDESLETAGSEGDEVSHENNTEYEWYASATGFENSRGNLPWPVAAGTVITHFGPYQQSAIKCMSDGIYISLPVGSTVSTVADGVVAAVFDLGGTNAVIVKHGKYYTTYSNLDSVLVNKGDTIKVSSAIGTVAAGDNGEGQLLFMVSNEKGSFLDPEKWLKRDYIPVALK